MKAIIFGGIGLRKNVNWSRVAELFDDCGGFEFTFSGPSRIRGDEDGRYVPVITHEDEKIARYLLNSLGGVYYTGPELDEKDEETGKTVHKWRIKGHKNRLRFFEGVLPYSKKYTKELREALVNEVPVTLTFDSEAAMHKFMEKITTSMDSSNLVLERADA